MRFPKLPAFATAAILATATAAWAYIAPTVFTMADPLAQDAADIHNYLHASHPGTLSGFASHDFDDAMDDLAFELTLLGLGGSTEAQVKSLNQVAITSFATFKKTIQLEGLLPTDPTLKKMWKDLLNKHMVFQTWFKVGSR